MKKLYTSITFALLSIGAFSQTETIFANADDVTPGLYTWSGSHTVTVVDNPLSDAVNSSAKVYYFNGGAWGGIANWNDAGTTLKNEYTAVVFDVYVTALAAGDKAYFKIQCDNTVSSGAANLDVGMDIHDANKWVTVTLDISAKTAIDYKQFAVQSEVAQYYIDNIRFISPTTSSKNKTYKNISVLSQSGSVKINGLNGDNIKIYNLSGSTIINKTALSSSETIELPKGIYLVNAGGKTSKVVVK